ncbi:MAG: L,D-transpeptidase [Thermoleophilia bacterium]|nr:L,D-transpeptidase [Thermoleophilia bacterium]MDH4345684.1 L,D-transpeptidase [Thermoleophilia bacterium]
MARGPLRGRRSSLGLGVLALVVGLAVAASGTGAVRSVTPSRDHGAAVAKIVVRTNVRSRPGAGPIVWRIPTTTHWGGGPQQLLVLGRALDGRGREWLRVRLPIRPNGSTGWVNADHVRLSASPYWIDVALGARTITVYRRGTVARRFGAVIGAPATPTPTGLHAIYDPIAQPSPGGFLGPWALHLTAFSNVLDDYGGGPGRVAIHGRGGASLRDPLGSARSHGCIRVDNANVVWLARHVPRGTPVMIRR